MRRYFFKAKDKNGVLVTGEVEGSSLEVAAKLVKEKGLFVVSIKPVRESLFSLVTKFRENYDSGHRYFHPTALHHG